MNTHLICRLLLKFCIQTDKMCIYLDNILDVLQKTKIGKTKCRNWENRSWKLIMFNRENRQSFRNQDRTIKTAAKRTANPNTSVRRLITGENRRRSFSTTANSAVGFRWRVRTFCAISFSCARDIPMSKRTRVNLIRTAGGHSPSEVERSTWWGRRMLPVITRIDRAIHTSARKRRAMLINPRWAEEGSGSFLRSGTATRDRNSIPPTQKVADVRWIQTRIMSNSVTIKIVTRFTRLH